MELQSLVYNAALLLAGSIVHSFILARWRSASRLEKVVEGFLYGFMAVLAMTAPLTIVPGVIFDSRSVILSLGGLLGGPIVAGVSGLIAIAYRLYLGGAGAFTGVGSVVLSAGMGTLYRHLLKGNIRNQFIHLDSVFGKDDHAVVILRVAEAIKAVSNQQLPKIADQL